MTNTFPARLSAQLPAARAPAPHGNGAGRAGLAVVGALAALGPDGQQTPLLPRRAPREHGPEVVLGTRPDLCGNQPVYRVHPTILH